MFHRSYKKNKFINVTSNRSANKRKRKNPNKFELKMYSFLQEAQIKYIPEYRITNTSKFYDVYLPEYNCLVEFDGDYFHRDINECDNAMQTKNYFNDKFKDVLANVYKFKLIRITETESKSITNIKQLIIEKINAL